MRTKVSRGKIHPKASRNALGLHVTRQGERRIDSLANGYAGRVTQVDIDVAMFIGRNRLKAVPFRAGTEAGNGG